MHRGTALGALGVGLLGALGGGGWWLLNDRGLGGPRRRTGGLRRGSAGGLLRVLVLGDGCAGAENQSKGLVHHLERMAAKEGLRVESSFRRLQQSRAFRLLTPSLHIYLASLAYPFWKGLGIWDADGGGGVEEALRGPFPDLVVASGRMTAPACVAVRRASGGLTFAVQIQDPRCSHTLFDAVVTPAHDEGAAAGGWLRLSGAKLVQQDRLLRWEGRRILTVGSLHGLDEEALQRAEQEAGHIVSQDVVRQRFVVCLLVGGPTSNCPWMPIDLMTELAGLAEGSTGGVGIVVLLSRRTPKDVAARLAAWARAPPPGTVAQVFGSDGFPGGLNPYKAALRMSGAIIVTADSVSMSSEAASVGRPVFVACRSRCRRKVARLHALLDEVCGVHGSVGGRGAEEMCQSLPARAPRDTERVARMVLDSLLAYE